MKMNDTLAIDYQDQERTRAGLARPDKKDNDVGLTCNKSKQSESPGRMHWVCQTHIMRNGSL